MKIEGDEAVFQSMGNVLRYLKHKTTSYSTVEVYAESLSRFYVFTEYDLNQLLTLKPNLLASYIHSFLGNVLNN